MRQRPHFALLGALLIVSSDGKESQYVRIAGGAGGGQAKCHQCIAQQRRIICLYSSVEERQSCKLKVLGSIPNGGSSCGRHSARITGMQCQTVGPLTRRNKWRGHAPPKSSKPRCGFSQGVGQHSGGRPACRQSLLASQWIASSASAAAIVYKLMIGCKPAMSMGGMAQRQRV